MRQGIEAAGSPDAERVADWLRSDQQVDTVMGPIAFDEKGDRKDEDYAMYVWKKSASGTITYSMID